MLICIYLPIFSVLSDVGTQCTASVSVFLQFSGMGFLPSTPNHLKQGVHNARSAPVDLSYEPYHSNCMYSFTSEYHSMYVFPCEDVYTVRGEIPTENISIKCRFLFPY